VLVEGSIAQLGRGEHREHHIKDFARWSSCSGPITFGRYGTAWFSLLARRRWERISAEALAEVFAAMNGGRS
jgi:hypothetical protein